MTGAATGAATGAGPVVAPRGGVAPAELLRCAQVLRADARAAAAADPDVALHLDLALADAEFARVLGTADPAGPGAARRSWQRAAELVATARGVEPWLHGGAAQAGWTALAVGSAPPAALDGSVLAWIDGFPADGDVDLPRGLLGLGVYALAHPDEAVRERGTAGVLAGIAARAESDADGLFVRLPDTPLHRRTGLVGHRLLGLCHGAAGLVSYLASAAGSGLRCAPRAAELLAPALRWVRRQRAPVGGSRYPRSVETRATPARSAWCHGDPGVATALAVVAAASEGPDAAAAGAEAARTAAAVLARPERDAGVVDACLCHGAAGLLWFGTRVRTGAAPGPRAAADRSCAAWAGWLLTGRAAGPVRYLRRLGPDPMGPCPSFLEGDLGAALALLGAATGGRPSWEPLLLAAPVRPFPAPVAGRRAG